MSEVIRTYEQFKEILRLTKEMWSALRDKQDLKRFNLLFTERSDLFDRIDSSLQADDDTNKLIQEILSLDEQINEALKMIAKEIAYQQIRLTHAAHSLEGADNHRDSYIDIKK